MNNIVYGPCPPASSMMRLAFNSKDISILDLDYLQAVTSSPLERYKMNEGNRHNYSFSLLIRGPQDLNFWPKRLVKEEYSRLYTRNRVY